MSIFSEKKTVRRPGTYHKKDPDMIAKENEQKRKQKGYDRAADLVKDDPDAEREYISKLIGVEIKAPDPDKKFKQEIKTLIAKTALDEIQNDPQLRKDFARRQVAELIGEPSPTGEGHGEFYGAGSNISQSLDELAELYGDDPEELRARLRGRSNGGILTAFSNPQVLEAMFGFLSKMMAQKDATLLEPLYVVRVDGQTVQIPKSQYDKLLNEGKVKPFAELESPKKEEPPAVIASPTYPQLPTFFEGTDFSMVHEWLDLTPDDFIVQLEDEVAQGADAPKLIWGFLTTATYDRIVSMITPYKDNPKVSALIEQVLADEGKEWLEQVLDLVKGETASGK